MADEKDPELEGFMVSSDLRGYDTGDPFYDRDKVRLVKLNDVKHALRVYESEIVYYVPGWWATALAGVMNQIAGVITALMSTMKKVATAGAALAANLLSYAAQVVGETAVRVAGFLGVKPGVWWKVVIGLSSGNSAASTAGNVARVAPVGVKFAEYRRLSNRLDEDMRGVVRELRRKALPQKVSGVKRTRKKVSSRA